MKVLLINGSPRINGNTTRVLKELTDTFQSLNIDSETIQIGTKDIRGCIACFKCSKTGKCVFNDIVNEVAEKFKNANGIIIASPVYYASPNGSLISFLDRLFFSTEKFDKTMKVGASVVVCRRGGASASFDVLNKYFTISNMPIASSQYWNVVHGMLPGEVENDLEGLQTMRTLAKNMTFLMKSIELGKKEFGLPEKEEWIPTHFIR